MRNQIEELNTYVKTRVAPSPIHGVGVVALFNIKKGEPLYADMMTTKYTLTYDELQKVRKSVKDLILERFPDIVNGSHFLYPDTRIQAFMNHSDVPNYDAMNDVALVDIKKGEEILEDYRKITNYEKVFPWLVV